MSKKRKRKKRIITEDIKFRRRIKKRKKENSKKRHIFQFWMPISPEGHNHIKSYYINNNRYWISNFREKNSNRVRYLVTRYGTEYEIKFMKDACGSDCPLIDIALCNNMREGFKAIIKDAENPITVEELFDFERFGQTYEDMKNMHKEMEENKDE